jgi:hypothetical protein
MLELHECLLSLICAHAHAHADAETKELPIPPEKPRKKKCRGGMAMPVERTKNTNM